MEDILFSILIPAYKQKFLKIAIESCLLQTYSNLEVVILNDNSPEKLKCVINEFNDSRIKYYENNKNYGSERLVDTWNKGISLCTGDFVICMGDDDCLKPNCLKCYYNIIILIY